MATVKWTLIIKSTGNKRKFPNETINILIAHKENRYARSKTSCFSPPVECNKAYMRDLCSVCESFKFRKPNQHCLALSHKALQRDSSPEISIYPTWQIAPCVLQRRSQLYGALSDCCYN